MNSVLDFLQQIQGRLKGYAGMDPQNPNSTPSGVDIAGASIAPQQNPRGVWQILAQLARLRGQNSLATLFASKEEQDRQLKNQETAARTGYYGAMGRNFDADNERADLAARQKAAQMQIDELMKTEGQPTGKMNVNYIPEIPINPMQRLGGEMPGGQPAAKEMPANNPEGPAVSPEMANPSVKFPMGYGQPDMEIGNIPTRSQVKQQDAWAKIMEELGKPQNISEGGALSIPLFNMMIRNPKMFPPEKLDDLQKKFNAVKANHQDWTDEQIYREIANFGDDPTAHLLAAFRLKDLQQKDEEQTADNDYYAHQLLPNEETGVPGLYADQLIKMLPRYSKAQFGNIFRQADQLSGGKFNINNSYLQGEASLKNVSNLMKADYAAQNAEANYKRMLEDYQEIQNAQKGIFTGRHGNDIGAMDMDLLARHIALTIGGVPSARVGKDIIAEHRNAIGLSEEARRWAEQLYAHPGSQLGPTQRLNFLQLGRNAYQNAIQLRDSLRQAPTISTGGLR